MKCVMCAKETDYFTKNKVCKECDKIYFGEEESSAFQISKEENLYSTDDSFNNSSFESGGNLMIKCPVCQTENSKEAIYCKGCGTTISLALEAARRVESEDKSQGRDIPIKKKERSGEKISNKERSEIIWYYAANGKRMGPVSPNDLQKMYKSEMLSSSSKVWKSGMPDWVELGQTNVIDIENTPPPLVGNDINNTYAWALAIVPIVLAFITNQITKDISLLTLVILLLTVMIWILDKAALKKAGYKSSGWMYTVLLLTPLYLFIRAHRTGKKYGYAICWCVLFAFYIIIIFAISLASI